MQIERIPLDQIKVSEDRLRKDLGDIPALAASIRTHGLLHPLVIDENNVLVSGERRLRALQKLKWKDAPVQRFENLSDLQKLEIELEENTRRSDLTWQEQVLAKKRLFELRKTRDSIYLMDFAEDLGESIGKVSEDLKVAEELESNPASPLWSETKISKAKKKLKASTQAKVYSALAQVLAETNAPSDSRLELHLGDSRELLPKLDRPVACLITDPPWGVGFTEGEWDDSKAAAFPLMQEVFTICYEKLLPDSHAYIRFGMAVYSEALELLRSIGWKVSPLPIIELLPWNKTGLGRLVTWNSCYSTWFFCWKGSRDLKPPVSNVIPVQTEGRVSWHPSPVAPGTIEFFLRASTNPGELVLDPFMGSAPVARACKKLKRRFYGCELNKTYYNLAYGELMEGKPDGN